MAMKISAKEVKDLLKNNPELKIKEKLNPECLKSGHFCSTFQNQDACFQPSFKKMPDGTVEIAKLRPCRKSGKQKFEVSS